MGIRYIYLGGDYETGTEIQIEQDNWSVIESIGSKSIFTFVITDLNGATLATEVEVTFYDDTENDGVAADDYIWGGTITNIDDYSPGVGLVYYNITAVDYNELVERVLIVKGFENRTITYMVNYLIDNFFCNVDSEISTGTIDADVTINKVPFNYMFGHSALNHLKDFGNYMWNINKNKELNFHIIGYTTNPTDIDDDSLRESINDFRRQRDLTNYRNRQYVKGADRLSVEQPDETPTPLPDGSSREFFVKYKIGKTPTIEVKTNGTWDSQTVGLTGLQEGATVDWWWSYGSTQISYDESQHPIPLQSGDQIRVTYKGLIPLIIITQDSDEIDLRGYYDAYDYNGKLEDTEDALRYGYNLLNKYANEADTLLFTKYEKTYEPGEMVSVIMNELRTINEEFLIKECTWIPQNINNIIYNYEILDSPNTGGWEDFFENLIQATKIYVDTDEIVIVVEIVEEELELDGEYTITAYTPLFPATDLYPSTSLWPNTTTPNPTPETVND